jgi:predicted metal-dependent phosphoesterase TrpH
MSDGGVTRVDLHVKILDEAVVQRAKEADLDVLVYAPHFTHISDIRTRAERFSDEELLVVPAREYFIGHWSQRRHVLAIDPDEPVPDFMPLDVTMAELESQETTVLAPHPGFLTMSLSRAEIHEYRHLIDAIDVYCPKASRFHNQRMQSIAAETDLPPYVSSYAHRRPTIGEVWVEYDRSIETAGDLRAAIESDAPCRLYRNDGRTHRVRCTLEALDLVRENTVAKFERVVLDGREATNPYSSGYDTRFAEGCVY